MMPPLARLMLSVGVVWGMGGWRETMYGPTNAKFWLRFRFFFVFLRSISVVSLCAF